MRQPPTLLVSLFDVAVLVVWTVYLNERYSHGTDFYALYFGAEQLLRGQSPYGPQATYELSLFWPSSWAATGVAYPLPFLLLMVPFTLLPFVVAANLWTALGFALAYATVILSRLQSAAQHRPTWYGTVSLILPFTFWPFYDGVRLSQATVLWVGIAVVLILGIRARNGWLTGICCVLLALKPQNGIVFTLYGLYWLWRHHKRGFALACAFGTLLLGVTLAMQPHWISAWVAQVQSYRSAVELELTTLFPLGGLVIFIAWRFRLPWWAQAAIAQVILFPLVGIYSLLPLLIAWCAFSPPLALIGTSISLLWAYLRLIRTDEMMWVFILLPLMLVILWEGRPQQLRTQRKTTTSTASSDYPQTAEI